LTRGNIEKIATEKGWFETGKKPPTGLKVLVRGVAKIKEAKGHGEDKGSEYGKTALAIIIVHHRSRIQLARFAWRMPCSLRAGRARALKIFAKGSASKGGGLHTSPSAGFEAGDDKEGGGNFQRKRSKKKDPSGHQESVSSAADCIDLSKDCARTRGHTRKKVNCGEGAP